ncbi:MAG: hypothetical protein Q8L23_18120 [Caulobacter sp.]|nr:hypothetical protein [Caulobacter sp.]
MIAALAILALVASSSEPASKPTLRLARNSQIVFLVPVESLSRQGKIAKAVLVSIYETPDESWELARRDLDLEIDCDAGLIRYTAMTGYDLQGRIIADARLPAEWEGIGEFPPFVSLVELACDGRRSSLVQMGSLAEAEAAARAELDAERSR